MEYSKICRFCDGDNNRRSYFCSRSCQQKSNYRAMQNDPARYKKRLDYQKKISLERFRKKKNLPLDLPNMRPSYGHGYIYKGYHRLYKPEHPNASRHGQIYAHTVIMSEKLGRPLFDQETVHHKNGIRTDNSLENLELWSVSQPAGQRVEDKIEWCKSFLELYGYTVISKG